MEIDEIKAAVDGYYEKVENANMKMPKLLILKLRKLVTVKEWKPPTSKLLKKVNEIEGLVSVTIVGRVRAL